MGNNTIQIERALKHAAQIGERRALSALNDTAFKTRKHIQEKIQETFDRPTPFIVKQIRYEKATKEQPRARVFVGDYMQNKSLRGIGDVGVAALTAESVLSPHVFGGTRSLKGIEVRLRYIGILPANKFIVPGDDVKLNQYGNMKGADSIRILSALQAFRDEGHDLNQTSGSRKRNKKALTNLFVITGTRKDLPTNYPPGVYQRVGSKVKQLLKFISKPRYKKRFAFFQLAETFFDREFKKQLEYQFRKSAEESTGPPSE